MKYYSDLTKKVYETVEDLDSAEIEWNKAHEEELRIAEEKKAAAEEIRKAAEAVALAKEHYNELVDAFIEKYGSYHLTVKTSNFLDNFFRW